MFRRVIRKIAMSSIAVLLAVTFPAFAAGADQASSPPEESAQKTPGSQQPNLRQLVAPIALYPDELVAQILTASEFPVQITEANQWLSDHQELSAGQLAAAANAQDWDPSVKALVEYPPVLQNLASNLSWTSDLGQAYATQPSALMNEVQALRRQAMKNGTLRSNSQIKVREKSGYITIEEAYPDTVYFPAYNPWLVYGYPVAVWPGWVEVPGCWWSGPGLYFGVGFGIGPYLGFGWGWPYWGLNWDRAGVFFHRFPYFERGPFFFNGRRFFEEEHNRGFEGRRFQFEQPYRGFQGRRFTPSPNRGFQGRHFAPSPNRGFQGRRFQPAMRSGQFGGANRGGGVRSFSPRGGGFHGGGGFHSGGFHGGGGFHGHGGRR
jgi:Protein of unknown function (DUF3300)